MKAQTIAVEAIQLSQRAGYAAKEIPPGDVMRSAEDFEPFLRQLIAELDQAKHRSNVMPFGEVKDFGRVEVKNAVAEVELLDTPDGKKWCGLLISVNPELPKAKK